MLLSRPDGIDFSKPPETQRAAIRAFSRKFVTGLFDMLEAEKKDKAEAGK